MGYAIVAFLFLLVVYLLLRELNCWYWKINDIVEKLGSIDGTLRTIAGLPPKAQPGPESKSPFDQLIPESKSPFDQVIDKPPKTQTRVSEPTSTPEADSFNCPQCGKSLVVDDLKIGANGLTKCPHCKEYFEVE